MNRPIKCYIYTRVSTAMQVDGFSLEAQKEKLRKYADLNEMQIVGEYSDAGFSGKNIQGRADFQRMLNDIKAQKDDISYVVARIISAMVHDERFATAIQAKIGKAINTDDLEQELQSLQGNLRQVENAKSRLETQMDLLDDANPHYERKMADLQRRYDEKYDVIAEIEEQIGEVRKKIHNIHQEVVTAENIYKILLSFDELYSCLEEKEKKELMQSMLEKVEIFPEKRKDGCWIRSITFKFPLPAKDGEIREFPLESLTILESVVCLEK